MDYRNKKEEELISEIKALQKQLVELKTREADHQRTTEGLQKSNRALKTLGACNEVLVRATSESALLDEICNIIVNVGGYRLAWVGFAENDPNKSVRPAAQAGYEAGYLESLNITWSDSERGRGPTGTAIRTGKPVFCSDYMTDPMVAPWKTQAIKRGYASGGAIPLIHHRDVFGSLNIYASERFAFDEGEIQLLVQLANDLAYGIFSLKEREELIYAEKTIRESEEEYRTLVEQASDGIVVYDAQGAFIEVNSAGLSLLKCTHEDVLKMKIKDFILNEDLSIAAKYFEAQQRGETVLCEMRIKCKDGSVIQTETNAKRIADGRFQAIMRDITSRKREAEDHIKVEKLESITILAGGIAHDFNNLLTAILGNISLALLSTDSGNPAFHRLAAAEKASLRAQELTQQLLAFSKRRSPAKKEISIKNLIIEAASFASRGTNIKCDFHLSPDLWVVEVDEGQINQVINNLIINAVQASVEGRKIKISAENITLEDSLPVNLPPGKYVQISIQDQGVGIPQENLTKIFDPYFTTKPTGSGLGLATSYSIIKKHGGEIIVTSRLNQGTTFSFYLPALDKISSDSVVKKEPLLRGSGRILLLDDEEDVLEVTAYMLKELGYEVVLARDGTEVFSIYQEAMESKKPFAAVIMDLTIPGGMGGKEVLPKLLKMDSGVRAIASSGYFSEPVMANWKSYHFCSVLSKPYRLADLGKALDQVLKKKDAAS